MFKCKKLKNDHFITGIDLLVVIHVDITQNVKKNIYTFNSLT